MTQALQAWMNGELLGTWTVDRHSHAFRYAPSWLESPHCRSLSLSLPISSALEIQGEEVKNFFDNLLPDNDRIRARLGRRFKLKSVNTFNLLEQLGRDCVGAIQLLPEGARPDGWNRIDCEPLSDDRIAARLQAVPSDTSPDSQYDDDNLFRISIAGAQEKTAFTRWQDRWCLPHGATPTTHIFKLPLGLIGGSNRVDASDSVQNEWLCAQIVGALGLPVAQTSMATFGGQTVLVVERFDRQAMERGGMDDGAWIARLPQEDLCQALGVAPERKYESDGGPGMRECLQLLQGSQAKTDTALFLLTQLAFFLLAAPDGHAKNFSIFLRQGDAYEMTPLYDILSMWPYFGTRHDQINRHKTGLAMAIRSKNTHTIFREVQARHWRQLAMKNGGALVWNAMLALAEQTSPALALVESRLPRDFPVRIWDGISIGMKNEAGRFLTEAGSLGIS